MFELQFINKYGPYHLFSVTPLTSQAVEKDGRKQLTILKS